MTFKPFTVVRALIISSVMPSLKYSFSGSALIFTKGRTTMDLLDDDMSRWLLIFYSTKLGLLLRDVEILMIFLLVGYNVMFTPRL
ncbi:hypothetical protein [Roseivirga sp.]|uniref:hypothetical protein n=1 Tax=Roseivirga sp. TaxID=1964215 RepID=UPI002B26CE31|nr:hypothetical protein [Roseivirga sp.]